VVNGDVFLVHGHMKKSELYDHIHVCQYTFNQWILKRHCSR